MVSSGSCLPLRKHFPDRSNKAYHGIENTRINSKASVIYDDVEGNLISVRLKGLQNLVEWTKIHSNGSLLNYLME